MVAAFVRCPLILLLSALWLALPQADGQMPEAADAWLVAPGPGETTAVVSVTLRNPTMYEVFVVGVRTDAARTARLERRGAGGAAETVSEVPLAAYGSASLSADGVHVRLTDLTRPLAPGDTVPLVFTTDGGATFRVAATVRPR